MSPRRNIRFIETIGKGGFGAVYLAEVQGRGGFTQRLAVKVLSEELSNSADVAARHRDEARLLGLLNHDQIVKVFDMVEIAGRPALLMEYVDGADCGALMRQGPLPPRAAFEIAQSVASALHFGWSTVDPASDRPLQVVHRDIKPANLLISRHGGVKVLDFGIARGDFDREGRTESVQFGTARYMAPEQWLYTHSSDRVDIFALGMSLLELLAGRQLSRPPLQPEPFQAHLQTAIRMVTAAERVAPRGEEVRALLARMTAWEPEGRPDARQVHEACMEIAEQLPGLSLARFAPSAVPPLIAARKHRYRDEPLLPACELTAAPGRREPSREAAAPTERAPQRPVEPPLAERSDTHRAAPLDPRQRLLGASPSSLSGPQRTGLAALAALPTRLTGGEEDTEASGPAPARRGPPPTDAALETAPLPPAVRATAAPAEAPPPEPPAAEPSAAEPPAPRPDEPRAPAELRTGAAPIAEVAPAAAGPRGPVAEAPTAQAAPSVQHQDPRHQAIFEALTARGTGANPGRAHAPSLYQALLAAERTGPAPAAPPIDSVELRRSAAAAPEGAPRPPRVAAMIAAAIAATALVSVAIGVALDRQSLSVAEARAQASAPAAPRSAAPSPDALATLAAEPEPEPEPAQPVQPEPAPNRSPEAARAGRPARTAAPAAAHEASAASAAAPPELSPEPPATVLVRFISSPPGAKISVDGVNVGVTPTEPLPIAVGRRRVTVSDQTGACQSDLRISPVGSNTVACDLASGMLTRRH